LHRPTKQLDDSVNSSGSADAGGLFDDAAIEPQAPAVVSPAPVKKKRTLADLFSKTPADAQEPSLDVASADPVAPPVVKTIQKAPVAPVQTEEIASGGGDFVVQLASFRTRAEANTEYGRLQAKHAATLGRFSPIISEATVGGSTRFRLSVGRMTSQAQASAVCSSLFAGGERDCLVKRR
jgi:cell division septation protein DedD